MVDLSIATLNYQRVQTIQNLEVLTIKLICRFFSMKHRINHHQPSRRLCIKKLGTWTTVDWRSGTFLRLNSENHSMDIWAIVHPCLGFLKGMYAYNQRRFTFCVWNRNTCLVGWFLKLWDLWVELQFFILEREVASCADTCELYFIGYMFACAEKLSSLTSENEHPDYSNV